MSTGYESDGFGLIQLDGTITERARVAGGIARLVGALGPLPRAGRRGSEVAIVYNPLAHFVGGGQRATPTAAAGEVAGIEHDSLLGIYRALLPDERAPRLRARRSPDGERPRVVQLVVLPTR